MSSPKRLAKRQKLERKRLRKREARARRERKRQTSWMQLPFLLSPGGVKMSEVLSDFVAPYGDSWDNADAYRQLLITGIVAWNAALQPPSQRQAMVDDLVRSGLRTNDESVRRECIALIQELIERKLTYFAQYQRPIINFQLDELDDGGFHLSVASLMTK